jgi:hypothetical protein
MHQVQIASQLHMKASSMHARMGTKVLSLYTCHLQQHVVQHRSYPGFYAVETRVLRFVPAAKFHEFQHAAM